MLFLQLGSNLNSLSVILEKPILSFQFGPNGVQIGANYTPLGLNLKDKIGFSKITEKLLE